MRNKDDKGIPIKEGDRLKLFSYYEMNVPEEAPRPEFATVNDELNWVSDYGRVLDKTQYEIVEVIDQSMVLKKEWSEFRNTGLVLIINQILHIFGWALVFEMEGDEIKNVYPARVKYRGFDEKTTEEAYKKVSNYMLRNSKELNKEAEA